MIIERDPEAQAGNRKAQADYFSERTFLTEYAWWLIMVIERDPEAQAGNRKAQADYFSE